MKGGVGYMGSKKSEDEKILEYLKQVGKRYYRPDIKGKREMTESLFGNEFDPGRTLPTIKHTWRHR